MLRFAILLFIVAAAPLSAAEYLDDVKAKLAETQALIKAVEAAQGEPDSKKTLKGLYVLMSKTTDPAYAETLTGTVCNGLFALKQKKPAAKVYASIKKTYPKSTFVTELSKDGLKSDCTKCEGKGLQVLACETCKGKVACKNSKCKDGKIDAGGKEMNCPNCGGTGKCKACEGKGTHSPECKSCRGTGKRQQTSDLKQRYAAHLGVFMTTLKKDEAVLLKEKRKAEDAIARHEAFLKKGGSAELLAIFEKGKTPDKLKNVLKEMSIWTISQQRRIGGSVIAGMEAHFFKAEAVLFMTVKPRFLEEDKTIQDEIVEGLARFWNMKTTKTRSIRKLGRVVVLDEHHKAIREETGRAK